MEDKELFFKQLFQSDTNLCDFFLCDLFQQKHYIKEKHFIEEQEPNSRLGFLKAGYMKSYIIDYEGKEAITRFIKPGEMVMGGLAPGQNSPVSIQALTPSTLYEAPWNLLQKELKNHRGFRDYLNQQLAFASAKTTETLSNFIRLNARERYRLFLIDNADLLEQIPHYNIANFLGISPVQLSRIRMKSSINKG